MEGKRSKRKRSHGSCVLEHCLPEMGRCVGGEGADYSLKSVFPSFSISQRQFFLTL